MNIHAISGLVAFSLHYYVYYDIIGHTLASSQVRPDWFVILYSCTWARGGRSNNAFDLCYPQEKKRAPREDRTRECVESGGVLSGAFFSRSRKIRVFIENFGCAFYVLVAPVFATRNAS